MAKKQNAQSKSTLSLTKINKVAKQTKQSEMFTFSDDETLVIYPVFSETKVEALLEEMSKVLNYHEKEGKYAFTEKTILYYTYFLMIKYFTALPISDNPKTQLTQFTNILDTHYFKELVEEAFPHKEVAKVFDKATQVSAAYASLQKMDKLFKEKTEQLDLKNRDILFGEEKQIPEV